MFLVILVVSDDVHDHEGHEGHEERLDLPRVFFVILVLLVVSDDVYDHEGHEGHEDDTKEDLSCFVSSS